MRIYSKCGALPYSVPVPRASPVPQQTLHAFLLAGGTVDLKHDYAQRTGENLLQQGTHPLSVTESPPKRMADCRLSAQPNVTRVGTDTAASKTCSAASSSCMPSTTTMTLAAQLSLKLCSSPFACAESYASHMS